MIETSKMMLKLTCLLGVSLMSVSVWSITTDGSSNIVPGNTKWYTDYAACKAYADKTNTPLLLFWASTGCSYCEKLEAAVESQSFKDWQAERKIVCCFVMDKTSVKYVAQGGIGYDGKNESSVTAKNYLTDKVREVRLTQFPFVLVYWKKQDGRVIEYNFPGRPYSAKSGQLMPSKDGKDRDEQLRNSIDLILARAGGWDPNRYAGGDFVLGDCSGSRLEYVPGVTQSVRIPLSRSASGVATNIVKVGTTTLPPLAWGAKELSKELQIDVSKATGDVKVLLCDGDKVEHSSTVVHSVKAPANSVTNPAAPGESFDFGEWTLDYNEAKKKVAATPGSRLLAVFSGVLWCPYCKGIESSLYASKAFRDWAKTNQVALVLFDQGRATTPATAAGSNTPRLVTMVEENAGTTTALSGAAYVSRHGITEKVSTDYVNMVTKYTSAWRAYGSTAARLSNPTMLFVEDDKVVARLNFAVDASKVYDPLENVARLAELIQMSPVNEKDSSITATSLSLALGGAPCSVATSVNVPTKAIKLTGVGTGRIQVSSSPSAKLSLFKGATSVASGTGAVSFNVQTASDAGQAYAVLVEAYPNAATDKVAVKGDTSKPLTLTAQLLPIPGEIAFDTADFSLLKQTGSKTISLTRKNGASGEVKIKVSRVGGTATPGVRYDWKDQEFTWKDGEMGTKTFSLSVKQDVPYMADQTVELQLQKVFGDVDLSTKKLVVTLTDTTKPTMTRSTYKITLYKGFEASFEDKAYNVSGRVTLKRVSGTLPLGVKIASNGETVALGKIPLSVGTYTSKYSLVSGGQTGDPVTFEIAVKDPRAENPMLGTAFSATLPVFSGNRMVGQASVTMTSSNKLTVRYTCDKTTATTTFKGNWQDLEDNGCAVTELTKSGKSLRLGLSKEGGLSAEITDPLYPNSLVGVEARVGSSYENYAGVYTVALPSLSEDSSVPQGAGYVCIKMSSISSAKKGAASCSICFPDGKKASVTAYMTQYDADFACLTIFKRASNNTLAAPMLIRRKAADAPSMRAVIGFADKNACWTHSEKGYSFTRECGIYGSFFNEKLSLVECCDSELLRLELPEDVLGNGALLEVQTAGFKLVDKVPGLKVSYSRKNGTFSGTTRVQVNGRLVTAKFAGVIIPGWFDCQCGESTDSLIPLEPGLPTAMGSAVYSIGVKKTSLPVGLVPVVE